MESILKSELDNHLGYNPYIKNKNSRNRIRSKKLRSKYVEIEVNIPQNHESSFEAKIVKKRQKDIWQVEYRQHKLLNEVYPVVYIDAIHFSVRDNHVIKN